VLLLQTVGDRLPMVSDIQNVLYCQRSQWNPIEFTSDLQSITLSVLSADIQAARVRCGSKLPDWLRSPVAGISCRQWSWSSVHWWQAIPIETIVFIPQAIGVNEHPHLVSSNTIGPFMGIPLIPTIGRSWPLHCKCEQYSSSSSSESLEQEFQELRGHIS